MVCNCSSEADVVEASGKGTPDLSQAMFSALPYLLIHVCVPLSVNKGVHMFACVYIYIFIS